MWHFPQTSGCRAMARLKTWREWQAEQAPLARWAPDLDTPYYRFWARSHMAILALSLLAGAAFGGAVAPGRTTSGTARTMSLRAR